MMRLAERLADRVASLMWLAVLAAGVPAAGCDGASDSDHDAGAGDVVVVCGADALPATGQACDLADRDAGVVCRANCLSGCHPDCTCGPDLRWNCESTICRDWGWDASTCEAGVAPRCTAECLP